jgi:hypothetical protein
MSGVAGVTFSLYKDQEGGVPLWMETQNVQLDKAGRYSVMLGSAGSEGLPSGIFDAGEARWLGVQVQPQAEQPRVLLLSVPYALKAADAETIGGLPPAAFMRATPEAESTTVVANARPQGRSEVSNGPQSNIPVQTPNPPGGQVGFVPLWTTAPNIIGSSGIFQSTAGNVGVGISTPSFKLHVGVSNNGLRVEGPTVGTISPVLASFGGTGDFNIDAFGVPGGRFTVRSAGNVGVGISAPSTLLHVDHAPPNGNGIDLLSVTSGGSPAVASLLLQNTASGGLRLREGAGTGTAYLASSGTLSFITSDTGTPSFPNAPAMLIDRSGNVGIGKGNLNVNGYGTLNGVSTCCLQNTFLGGSSYTVGFFGSYGASNILVGALCFEGCSNVFRVDKTGKGFFDGGTQTGGADFAESVSVAGSVVDYQPGDLLTVDPEGDRQLKLTNLPYSTLVAGVYSTKPGVLATPHKTDDPAMASEVPLAVVGIVPCKVSTENGTIRRGDLLVSSSIAGYAMKGTDRSRMLGATVGKALEPLTEARGVIQVLVTLQ